jgi:hypothetical protein
MNAHYYTKLRRSRHQNVLIDPVAVAIAHHRRYHADSFCLYDPETCERIDDTDREYAAELVEVLAYLPERPDTR